MMNQFKQHRRRLAVGKQFISVAIIGLFLLDASHRISAAATNSPALTRAQVQTFADNLQRSMITNRLALAGVLDADMLLDIALRGIASSETEQFRTGFKSTFGQNLEKNFADISNYKLLHLVETNGEFQPLFRMLLRQGGVNYHRLMLKRTRTGDVHVADFLPSIPGEWMSTTVRRMALPMFVDQEKSFLERLVEKESDQVKYEKEWSQVVKLAQDRKWAESLAAYRNLPDSLQRESFLLAIRLRAAQQVGDDEYQQAMDFWEKSHPGEAAVYLVSIDGLMLKKQYTKALAAIDHLDRIVGGDPYLNVLRATQYLLLEQPAKARECVDKALELEPTLAPAYDAALNMSLHRKDYQETARLLTALSRQFKVDLRPRIAELTDYKDFRDSEYYAEWKKTGPEK